jgi:hypothetical protein
MIFRTRNLRCVALLVFAWIGSASAAELEIGKLLAPTAVVKQAPSSNAAEKRVRVSRPPTRLALQEDLRVPTCSMPLCVGLFLGVGY